MNNKLTINRKYLIIDILFSILSLVFFILFLYFCIIDFNIVLLLGSIFMFIFALNKIDEIKVSEYLLDVMKTNQEALALYKKLGFKVIKKRFNTLILKLM